MESESVKEKNTSGGGGTAGRITLQRAVDLGEYEPSHLSKFDEWHLLSRHVQFQFIKKGLENCNAQLLREWAELNNTLDFRLKPHLQDAMDNVWKKLKKLEKDHDRLYVEYSR